MNKGEFYEHCAFDLGRANDETRLKTLEALAQTYVADETLHSPEATALLLSESLKQDTLQAEAALEKYDKHTKPRFFLSLAAAVTIIVMAIIQAAPFEGKGVWVLILVLLMLYVCLVMLPSWRKRLPELREAVKGLAENAIDAASPDTSVSHWMAATANRQRIVDVLAKANYRNPFPSWSEQLLGLVVTAEE